VRRWLPHPIASGFVLLVWLGLYSSLAPIYLATGVLLAVSIPAILKRALDDPVTVRRPGVALRLAGVVLWDIVVANLAVARRVLGPLARLRPGFIEVPLDLAHPDAVALLASIIAITPGTVVADDAARTRILVHVLDLDDAGRLVAEIKHRYERPLKEIFRC
jgi:multicomponent K+:H+ antiporter subunit E